MVNSKILLVIFEFPNILYFTNINLLVINHNNLILQLSFLYLFI